MNAPHTMMEAGTAQTRRIPADSLPPAELVERLFGLTSDLTTLLSRETELLHARAQEEVATLQAEKIRLSNEYAMDAQAIRLRKELLDRAPAERVSRLKATMSELDRALALNSEALLAAKSVSESLIRMVADAMGKQAAPSLGYGRNAAPASRQSPSAIRNGSITLDAQV